jgi:hypothetical protein
MQQMAPEKLRVRALGGAKSQPVTLKVASPSFREAISLAPWL